MNHEKETVGQWLEALATRDTSTEQDARRMENLLHRIGFPRAVCVLGVVYLEGKGTIEAPPAGIHAIAQMLVAKAKVQHGI